jgi:hypothetical protein
MNFIRLFKEAFLAFIWRRVALYDGSLFSFEYKNGSISIFPSDENTKAIKILVLTKKYYFESHTDLPVQSNSEAEKIAKNTIIDSPLSGSTSQVNWVRTHDNKYILNTATFSDDINSISNLWFVIPVGWLLASSVKKAATFIVNGQTICLSDASAVLETKLLGENPQVFAGSDLLDLPSNSQQQTYHAISRGLFKLPLKVWLNARVVKNRAKSLKVNPKAIVATVSIFVGVYLLASSLYLVAERHFIQHKLELATNNVETAFDARREYQTIQSNISGMSNVLSQQKPSWLVLPQITRVIEGGARITSLNYYDDVVELFGNAPRATDVLLMIQQFEYVEDAEFLIPVRENSRLQTQNFAITWKLKSNSIVIGSGSGESIE